MAAKDAVEKWQAAAPKWQAAEQRARTHQLERPGQPMPSELSGVLSEMIVEAELLEAALIKAFGPDLPKESAAGFEETHRTIARMREILRKTEN